MNPVLLPVWMWRFTRCALRFMRCAPLLPLLWLIVIASPKLLSMLTNDHRSHPLVEAQATPELYGEDWEDNYFMRKEMTDYIYSGVSAAL